MCDVKDEFNVFFEKKHLCSSLVFDWGEKANICANINEMFHSAFAFNERMQEHSRSFFTFLPAINSSLAIFCINGIINHTKFFLIIRL